MDSDSDIGRTARGDHLAFGRIVAAHQARVFAYLGRMGLDRTTAEDIAQEAFLRVWRNAGQFNPKLASLSTWIVTIARNLALTRLSRSGPAQTIGDDLLAALPSGDAPADETLITRQRHARLRAAISQLPAADRSLLAASYAEDLSLADIARIEGCTQGAAKVRLHRARLRLRKLLEANDA